MRYKSVRRHLSDDDYFGTLATILDLLRQELEGKVVSRTTPAETLSTIRDELVYLQEHYKIVRRRTRP